MFSQSVQKMVNQKAVYVQYTVCRGCQYTFECISVENQYCSSTTSAQNQYVWHCISAMIIVEFT